MSGDINKPPHMRLTKAQKRGLELLATPGAVARGHAPGLRWRVMVGETEIGTIAAESLLILRVAGLVSWFRDSQHQMDVHQQITEAGRQVVGGAS